MRGLRRVVAALWSGLCLAAMLAVPPWLLVVWFGNPLPPDPPQQPYLHEWIITVAVLLGWCAWLGLVALVVWQVRLAVRRVRMPRVHVTVPPQGVLAGLVGAVVAGTVTIASRGAALPTPAVAPAATQPMPTPDQTASGVDQQSPPGLADASRTGSGSPDPGDEQAPAVHRESPVAGAAAGVQVPGGGWLPDGVAQAVSVLSAVVWVGRRRRYIPRPIPTPDPTGPPTDPDGAQADLQPLPETAQAVTACWADATAADRPADTVSSLQTTTERTLSGQGRPGDAATTGVIGSTDAGPLHPRDLPPGGVGLVGAGAHGAARGAIVALLVTHAASGPVRVVTTDHTLAQLLGPSPDPLPAPLAGLAVCPDPIALVHLVEEQILHPHRTTPPRPAHGTGPTGQDDPGTAAPTLLIVTAVPDDRDLSRRLAVALTASQAGVYGLLLGAWAHGITWHIHPDGHITAAAPSIPDAHTDATYASHGAGGDPDPNRWAQIMPAGDPSPHPGRMCTLPPQAARDLLALSAAAHPTLANPLPTPAGSGHVAKARPDPTTPAFVTGAVLRVRLLGGVSVLAGASGQLVPVNLELARRAALQILVLLVLHPNGATSSALAAALWPGQRPRPVHRLYNPASALRSQLRQATGHDMLTRDGELYHLDQQHIDVDLWQLTTALTHARTTSDPHTRARALRTAVDTYTGELAAGREWPWIIKHRETLRRQILNAYTELAALQPYNAPTLLARALDVDPYNEHLLATQHTTSPR